MKILSIVGTRPQYIKVSAISTAARHLEIHHDWLDTGQHYSPSMSDNFVNEFELKIPVANLRVGSGAHGQQTAKILVGVEVFLESHNYDAVIVYGDTNSTLAGALAATKLNIPVAHIEAGLRSKNMSMPEEKNRIIVDHISNFLFAPTELAIKNLNNEGLNSAILSGDIMFDVILNMPQEVGKKSEHDSDFILCTIHRVENTDSEKRLKEIFAALAGLGTNVVIPAHPRLAKRISQYNVRFDNDKIKFIDPLSHKQIVDKIIQSKCVITDSGGLQKEAFLLKKICVTMRHETEWEETLDSDWNILNPNLVDLKIQTERKTPNIQSSYFGNGKASEIILGELISKINN